MNDANDGRTLIKCEKCGKFFYDLLDFSIHEHKCKEKLDIAKKSIEGYKKK